MKKIVYGIFIVFLGAGVTLLAMLNEQEPTEGISSFEDCAKAGYPILESYPRQCRTPDDRTFVSQRDVFEITKDVGCRVDDDCQLVNRELGFGCCWAGACEQIDYSLDKWIVVNKKWFAEQRPENCPSVEECGPAPMCPVRVINDSFTAKCISGACRKVSK